MSGYNVFASRCVMFIIFINVLCLLDVCFFNLILFIYLIFTFGYNVQYSTITNQ